LIDWIGFGLMEICRRDDYGEEDIRLLEEEEEEEEEDGEGEEL